MAIPPKSHPKEYWEVYCKTAALGRGGGEVYEFCASLSIIIRIHPIPLHHQQKREKFMKSSHEVTAPAMTVWQGQGSIHEIERSNDITFNVIVIMVNDDIASADWRSQFWKQPRWVIKPSTRSLLDLGSTGSLLLFVQIVAGALLPRSRLGWYHLLRHPGTDLVSRVWSLPGTPHCLPNTFHPPRLKSRRPRVEWQTHGANTPCSL